MSGTAQTVAFVGGGNMAKAMLTGLAALTPTPRLVVASPTAAKHPALQALGATTTTDNQAAVREADLVVLAVKPQKAAEVMPGIAAVWQPHQVLVSVLAGMPTAKLEAWLPAGARVVRTMPNTPLAIGQGMVGMVGGAHASAADLAAAAALFAPSGKVLQLADEAKMDAITAVSGSGPAYIFRFAEALLAGAENLGFTRDEAALLVGQTLAGATAYLMARGVDQAATLRTQVTSPGGTTAAALRVVDERDLTGLWVAALAAAEARGKELGRG